MLLSGVSDSVRCADQVLSWVNCVLELRQCRIGQTTRALSAQAGSATDSQARPAFTSDHASALPVSWPEICKSIRKCSWLRRPNQERTPCCVGEHLYVA